jgi:hypothetical protein
LRDKSCRQFNGLAAVWLFLDNSHGTAGFFAEAAGISRKTARARFNRSAKSA